MTTRLTRWLTTLDNFETKMAQLPAVRRYGRLTRATGLVLEATGLQLPLGATCVIERQNGSETHEVESEVVGFNGQRLFLMPLEEVEGVLPGARVYAKNISAEGLQSGKQLPLGPALLGRVLDGSGKPLDGLPSPDTTETGALITPPFNPLQRTPIEHVLDTGVRPINALLTVGRGQRMGLFAGSGVGKSVLLGMMARYTRADVIVVGLIGERGREVKDFIENILGAEGRARSVVIAAPADVSPLLRMQGAAYATRIAEDFRDRGQHVLLIMDSLTRYAMAQREIALAIGEPPPPKVIHRRCLPNYRHWSSVPEMALAAAARLPRFIPCLLKAMTSRTPLQTPRGRSSTVTLCCLADWRKPGTIRLSILKRRSAAQ